MKKCALGLVLLSVSAGSVWGQGAAPSTSPVYRPTTTKPTVNVATVPAVKSTAEVVREAEMRYQKQDVKGAVGVLDAAIAKDEKNPELLFARARLYMAMKEWDKAVADLDGVDGIRPGEVQVGLARLQVYEGKGQIDKAVEAVKGMVETVKAPPQARAVVLDAAAKVFYQARDYDGAIKYASELATMAPGDPRVERMRATFYAAAGRYDDAVKSFGEELDKWKKAGTAGQIKAEDVRRAEMDVRWQRGAANLKAKKLEPALRDFVIILEAAPGNPQVEKGIADAVGELGGEVTQQKPLVSKVSDLVAGVSRQMRERMEKDAALRYGATLTKAREALTAGKTEEAEKLAGDAVKIYPWHESYQVRAEARVKLGKVAEAIVDYRVAGALAYLRWSADSVMNYKDAYAGESDIGWAWYLSRKAEGKPSDLDKKLDAALVFEGKGDFLEAFLLVQPLPYEYRLGYDMRQKLLRDREVLSKQYVDALEKAIAARDKERVEALSKGYLEAADLKDDERYVRLAQAQEVLGNKKEMVQYLEMALYVSPRAGLLLGDMQAADGQTKAAMLTYNVGAGGQRAAELKGAARDAAAKRDALEGKQSGSFLQIYVDELNGAIKDKFYEKAIPAATRLIQVEPKNAGFYTARGLAYHRTRKFDQAEKDYLRAMELDPSRKLLLNLGDVCYGKKEYEKAVDYYTKGLADSTSPAVVYRLRGSSQLRLKKYDKALADAELAVKADEKNANGYMLRANANYWLKNWDAALADYQKVSDVAADGSTLKVTALGYSMLILQRKINGTIGTYDPEKEKGAGPGMEDF